MKTKLYGYNMARVRRAKLVLQEDELSELKRVGKSRTESSARVKRAKILLMYYSGNTITQVSRELNQTRALVGRAIDKALEFGALPSLDDPPRSGRPRSINDEAINWVLNLACQRPADIGLAAELWTYSALVKHIRKHCAAEGHECLKDIGKGMLNRFLSRSNVKPHKVSYYLERRDEEFETKMADVLCVYREVGEDNDNGIDRCQEKKTTLSYDEKPGIQAIKNTAPQLTPVPGQYSSIARDHEYKRLGTVSLLAGIDLHTGKVLPLVKERHRSKEFIEFLKLIDQEYPEDWKIRIVLDNHTAHTSKETRKYLSEQPNRFEFIFTPKHGSWLNMIEVFFSKISRGFLRHIRVESKDELIERIYKGIEEINQEPVVFKWKYKIENV